MRQVFNTIKDEFGKSWSVGLLWRSFGIRKQNLVNTETNTRLVTLEQNLFK